jgi:hypothetical protein
MPMQPLSISSGEDRKVSRRKFMRLLVNVQRGQLTHRITSKEQNRMVLEVIGFSN